MIKIPSRLSTLHSLRGFIYLGALLFVFILCATPVRAGEGSITMDEYLTIVRRTHPLFEGERLTPLIEESLRERHLGARDWRLNARGGYSRYGDVSRGIAPTLLEEYSASVSVERPIWMTGGRLKTELSSGLTESEFEDLGLGFDIAPSKLYESTAAITYSQPLLKNRGGNLDRLDYELSAYSIEMSKLRARENEEAFILEVALKFMDWVLLTENKKITTRRLALAIEQLAQVRKKREANLVDEVDRLRSKDSKEIAAQNMVLTNARWKAVRAELAIIAGEKLIYDKVPAFDLYSIGLPARLIREPVELIDNSRAVSSLTKQLKQLKRERSGLVSAVKPDLSIDASVALKGGGGNLSSSVANDKTDAALFMRLAYPLGNRTANADLRRIDLLIRQTGLERDKLRLDLMGALTGLIIQIEEFEEILRINSNQIKSARRRTREEVKLYNQGRGELTFVIQSQDSEERAMLNYAKNGANYHALILELRALSDDLLKDAVAKIIPEGGQAR